MNPFLPPRNESSQPPPPEGVRVVFPVNKPYATYSLIVLTVMAYLMQMVGQWLTGTDILAGLGVKFGPAIRQWQLWRLVTPIFLHGSVLHIGFNMYALYVFGRGLEARFGRNRFLALYFLGGFAGNVFSFILTPAASLGASTSIFALLASEAVFLFQNRSVLRGQATRGLNSLVFMAIINLMFGFSVSGVDNWGHIGGMLGGLLFAWFGGPIWKVEGIFPNVHINDERKDTGLLSGSIAVLLFFIPLAAMGFLWPVGN